MTPEDNRQTMDELQQIATRLEAGNIDTTDFHAVVREMRQQNETLKTMNKAIRASGTCVQTGPNEYMIVSRGAL